MLIKASIKINCKCSFVITKKNIHNIYKELNDVEEK